MPAFKLLLLRLRSTQVYLDDQEDAFF